MAELSVTTILQHLQQPQANLVALLEAYNTEVHRPLWH